MKTTIGGVVCVVSEEECRRIGNQGALLEQRKLVIDLLLIVWETVATLGN